MCEYSSISKDNSIIIKAIGCICVILSHSIDSNYSAFVRWIGSGYLWVGIFFFFSGYGFRYSIENKKDYLHRFWLNKIFSIYLPFVIAEIMFIIFNYNQESFLMIILQAIGIKLANTTLWYIVELLILFFISLNLYKICNTFNKQFFKILIILYTLFLLIAVFFNLGTWWFISTSSFIIGLDFNNIVDYIKLKEKIALKTIIILTFMLFFVIQYIFSTFKLSIFGIPTNYIVTIIQMFIVPLFTIIVANWFPIIKSKFLHCIGLVSFEIYLLHNLVIG